VAQQRAGGGSQAQCGDLCRCVRCVQGGSQMRQPLRGALQAPAHDGAQRGDLEMDKERIKMDKESIKMDKESIKMDKESIKMDKERHDGIHQSIGAEPAPPCRRLHHGRLESPSTHGKCRPLTHSCAHHHNQQGCGLDGGDAGLPWPVAARQVDHCTGAGGHGQINDWIDAPGNPGAFPKGTSNTHSSKYPRVAA